MDNEKKKQASNKLNKVSIASKRSKPKDEDEAALLAEAETTEAETTEAEVVSEDESISGTDIEPEAEALDVSAEEAADAVAEEENEPLEESKTEDDTAKKAEKLTGSKPYDTTFIFDDPKKLKEYEEKAIKSKRSKKERRDDDAEEIDFRTDTNDIETKPGKATISRSGSESKRKRNAGGTLDVASETKSESIKETAKSKPSKSGKDDKDGYIRFKNVRKIYRMGEIEIEALAGVDFSISKGEFVIIAGASGAGKSTILNILGGMDSLSSGSIFVDGSEISKYNDKQLITYRRYDVGFVFQFYNLVQNLNALENVQLATQICKDPLDAEEIIRDVGLDDRKKNFPSQLSGGEQQRVAIARALAKNPKLLLCDEPTGALDYKTGKSILKLLQETSRRLGMTVVVITHNLALTAMGDRVIRVKSGRIESMIKNDNPVDIDQIEW